MSATNRQIAIAPVDADTEQTIRDACAAQGCTCGKRLKVKVTPLSDEEAARLVAEGKRPPGAAHYDVNVKHSPECPLLLAQMGRN